MAIDVRWDDEPTKTLIIMQFDPDWIWGEFQPAVLKALNYKNTVEHPVDVILDLSACEPLVEFDGMTYVWWLIRQCRKARRGYFILVSQDPILRVVANVVRQSHTDIRGILRLGNDMKDARAILAYLREK